MGSLFEERLLFRFCFIQMFENFAKCIGYVFYASMNWLIKLNFYQTAILTQHHCITRLSIASLASNASRGVILTFIDVVDNRALIHFVDTCSLDKSL